MKNLIPVQIVDADEFISTQNVGLITLWIIRENVSISFGNLCQTILSDYIPLSKYEELKNNLSDSDADWHVRLRMSIQYRAISYFSQQIHKLERNNLIEIFPLLPPIDADLLPKTIKEQSPERYYELLDQLRGVLNPDATLQVVDHLTELLNIFGLSLTREISRPHTLVDAYPIFGKPLKRQQNWPQVFVMMPFQPELKTIYENHILKVTKKLEIDCIRGDDFFSSQAIIDEIWSVIFHSNLCIADCTGRNPNVFYELGIAHTLGKSCILLAQSTDDIPFDVTHRRFIIYEPTQNGMHEFEDTLTKTIENERMSWKT